MQQLYQTNRLFLGLIGLSFLFSFLSLVPILSSLDQFVTLALPVFLVAIHKKMNLKETFKVKAFKPTTMVYLIGLYLCSLLVSSFVGDLTLLILGPNPIGIEAYLNEMQGGVFKNFFLIALTPAICEELMFRGILLNTKNKLSIHQLAWLNGLMFGLFHMGADQVFYTMILGTIYAYVAILTGSIFTTMCLHLINNGVASLALSFLDAGADGTALEEVITFYDLIPSLVLALFAALMIVYLLKRIKNQYHYDDQGRRAAYLERAIEEKPVDTFKVFSPLLFFTLIVVAYNLYVIPWLTSNM